MGGLCYSFFILPMNTIEHLQIVLPGQPIAWYQRIAVEIDAGRMPMPQLPPPPVPEIKPTPPPPPPVPEIKLTPLPPPLVPKVKLTPPPPPLRPEPPTPSTVYSYTKADLTNPSDNIQPPKEFIPRKAKKANKRAKDQINQKQLPPSTPQTKQQKKSIPTTAPIEYFPVLSRDLLMLCRNDARLATRLVYHQLDRNPGRDFQWAQEKAIWDLERDRR